MEASSEDGSCALTQDPASNQPLHRLSSTAAGDSGGVPAGLIRVGAQEDGGDKSTPLVALKADRVGVNPRQGPVFDPWRSLAPFSESELLTKPFDGIVKPFLVGIDIRPFSDKRQRKPHQEFRRGIGSSRRGSSQLVCAYLVNRAGQRQGATARRIAEITGPRRNPGVPSALKRLSCI